MYRGVQSGLFVGIKGTHLWLSKINNVVEICTKFKQQTDLIINAVKLSAHPDPFVTAVLHTLYINNITNLTDKSIREHLVADLILFQLLYDSRLEYVYYVFLFISFCAALLFSTLNVNVKIWIVLLLRFNLLQYREI